MTKPGANVKAVAGLWAEGLSVSVIAARLRLTTDAVKHIARANRDLCSARRPARGPGPAAPVVDRAARMWAQGRSASEIGAALGVTANTILGLTARKRERFPMRDPAARGEAGPVPVRPGSIPRTRVRGVSLAPMPWDVREPMRSSPSD